MYDEQCQQSGIQNKAKKWAHLVIVPSMSEMTTWSVESQTNMRAAHPGTPVVESENVIVFAPGFKFSDFCQAKKNQNCGRSCIIQTNELIR